MIDSICGWGGRRVFEKKESLVSRGKYSEIKGLERRKIPGCSHVPGGFGVEESRAWSDSDAGKIQAISIPADADCRVVGCSPMGMALAGFEEDVQSG